MIRVMLDSDRLDALPAGVAPLLATYSDLIPDLSEWHAFMNAHPGSVLVLIDRGLGDPTGLASVADVERGALTIADLPAWFTRKLRAKVLDLTVYCSRDSLAAANIAVPQPHWRWVATLDGTVAVAGMPPLSRPAVVQCLSSVMLGVHADGSLVLSPAWHRQP